MYSLSPQEYITTQEFKNKEKREILRNGPISQGNS